MKRAFFALTFVAQLATAGWAQTAREEIAHDIHLTAGNTLAYTSPKLKFTPAPTGMKPFYLSHYGRYGSQFLILQSYYDGPYETLLRADSLGKLTDFGKEILQRLTLIRNEATGRMGELTTVGVSQIKEIAQRMYERFPEVFQDEVTIDAHSTTAICSVLSMSNALTQLLSMNPKLHVRQNASQLDMDYMDTEDQLLIDGRFPTKARLAFEAFKQQRPTPTRQMRMLFNDSNYVKSNILPKQLSLALFRLASHVQNTELRKQLTLYDLFTDEELYSLWETNNAWWYIWYGPSPLNGATQPYSQRRLLRRMVQEADSCISLSKPGATLRFGNEEVLMSLACLLNLNAFGQQIEKLEKLTKKGWRNYHIIPMAANIQLVFYRGDGKSRAKDDVLVKVLLNEDEAILPINTSRWPYYRWEEVRNYILQKLDTYEKGAAPEKGKK